MRRVLVRTTTWICPPRLPHTGHGHLGKQKTKTEEAMKRRAAAVSQFSLIYGHALHCMSGGHWRAGILTKSRWVLRAGQSRTDGRGGSNYWRNQTRPLSSQHVPYHKGIPAFHSPHASLPRFCLCSRRSSEDGQVGR